MIEASDMESVLNRMRTLEETMPDGFDVDAQLMLRFKNGDAQAFDELFLRHTRSMINFAYRFVRDRQLAEEIAQEIFLRVYEAAGGYKPRARFATWLYRIATNVCLNEIRKPHFRAAHQSVSVDESAVAGKGGFGLRSGLEKNLETRAMAQALKHALEGIPEKQRVAFVLNKYEELSYAEVAEVMKTSEKAVKSLIHRAREALAARLRPQLPGLIQL